MLLLLLGCLDHDPIPGGVDDRVFVAMQSHFTDFRSWTTITLDGEIDGHSGTERLVFVSALPEEGSDSFPVGTLIVKSAPVGETVELHAMCADLHSSLGDARNAAASLALALQSGPASPDLHNRLGVSLYGLGDRDGARAHFSNALRLDPHNEDAKGNLDALANA